MDTSYLLRKIIKTSRRIKLLPVLILTLTIVAGSLNGAMAQKFNLSDWRVPPPLAPANTTKGNTTGKNTTPKTIVLTLTDIPAVSVPVLPDVRVPLLAAISTFPPSADVPDQPATQDADANLPQLPLPGAPDAPPLPKQTIKDEPTPSVVSLPMPDAPEMPAFPPARAAPSGQPAITNSLVPAMPDVTGLFTFSLPPRGTITAWAIPGIPENINLKPVTSADKNTGKKNIKNAGKHTGKGKNNKKVKTHHSKLK